ncbi:hypothetical protein Zm00014a_017977 [Zea mays]|jgi:hypothetical protein|uniref:Uncharacterized protein n=2 Tax=Zea mays TaxID=4577 RepID=K7VGL8_MAIZE|nr:uncharacterized protein LOC103639481 [Zea mays]AQL09079.1 hypothetical protein ZEAMMB73_Zm00001d048183 [Zea mays]PWZ06998.1 hypothetical protein Zm00014a_017977 [Zea mays]|eukprot:XP_008660453.1 uncharacterized protein LOC103639481 [Zea mays]
MADTNQNREQTLIAGAGLGLVAVHSGLTVYRAMGDKQAAVLFVAWSCLTLVLVFVCLLAYERAAPGSPARERASRAIWPPTTLLTLSFAWKVTADMPPDSAAAAALVWGLAIATTAGGFVALSVRAGP